MEEKDKKQKIEFDFSNPKPYFDESGDIGLFPGKHPTYSKEAIERAVRLIEENRKLAEKERALLSA
ncbi:MAG: hypothetical protein Q8P78_03040 [bacterium]|nr:hypothetical protein [bacterium]